VLPAFTTATELYDGTTWTSSPVSLNTGRVVSRCRNTTSALAFGANPGPDTAATEEWTGAGAAVTKTITVS
jgi:hypothetical protein